MNVTNAVLLDVSLSNQSSLEPGDFCLSTPLNFEDLNHPWQTPIYANGWYVHKLPGIVVFNGLLLLLHGRTLFIVFGTCYRLGKGLRVYQFIPVSAHRSNHFSVMSLNDLRHLRGGCMVFSFGTASIILSSSTTLASTSASSTRSSFACPTGKARKSSSKIALVHRCKKPTHSI